MKSIKGAFFIETSAKNNNKINELFFKAAETMYQFFKISNDFRNLVKPERSTFNANNFQSKRFSLEEPVDRTSKNQ